MIPDRTLERAVSCRSWRAALFLFLVVSYALPASPVEGGVETRKNAVPDTLAELYQTVKESPKNGDAWVRLGHTLLEAGDLKQGEKAFKKAIRYAKSAEAHNGLGLVYMADPLKRRLAVGCFRTKLYQLSDDRRIQLVPQEFYAVDILATVLQPITIYRSRNTDEIVTITQPGEKITILLSDQQPKHRYTPPLWFCVRSVPGLVGWIRGESVHSVDGLRYAD